MGRENKILNMIFEDIDCFKEDIDSLKYSYKEQAKILIDEEKYNESKNFTDRCKDLDRFKLKIDEMSEELDSIIDEEMDLKGEDDNFENSDDFVEIRNFAFTDPIQMKLFDKVYDIKGNWRDVLVLVCEELIKKNPDKVKKFDTNDSFKGRTRVYFSYDPNKLTKQSRKLSNGLYVELNMDNNDIVKRCRGALEECGYNPEEVKFKVERKKEEKQDGNDREAEAIEIGKDFDEIKLPRKYSSIHIKKELFSSIINEILVFQKNNNVNYISPVKIKEKMDTTIIENTNYSMSYHVVSNIFKYLIDCKLIDNFPNTKKGKYIITDESVLKHWVESAVKY